MKTLIKTISWRIIASIITMILVFIATGSVTLSFIVGIPETFIKMAAYYGHEKLWGNIQ